MVREGREQEQQYLQKQLDIETFQKSEDEFLAERVEAILRLMELNDPESADREEIKAAQKRLEKKLKKQKNNTPVYWIRKLTQTAAVICLLVLGANITTEALFDESLLHMFQSWGERYSVLPGDSEVEYTEGTTEIITSIDRFAEIFGKEFLISDALPEGYTLDKIYHTEVADVHNYIWRYVKDGIYDMDIFMYAKTENLTASFTGVDLNDKEPMKCDNGLMIDICQNQDEYIACFEYNNWWYLVQATDKNNLITMIEGMELYE